MKYLLAQLCKTLLDTYRLISGGLSVTCFSRHPSLGASFIGLFLAIWVTRKSGCTEAAWTARLYYIPPWSETNWRIHFCLFWEITDLSKERKSRLKSGIKDTRFWIHFWPIMNLTLDFTLFSFYENDILIRR